MEFFNTTTIRGVRGINAGPCIWLTGYFQLAPLSRRQSGQGPTAHGPADQPECREADASRHSPDLPVLSLPQNQFKPTDRNCRTVPDRRSSRPDFLRLFNTIYLTWPRSEIAKVHALPQLLQSDIGGDALNLRPVNLCQLVTGIGNPCLQGSIIGQYDQAFRIDIEATGGIDLRNRNVIGQRGSPFRRCKLRQDAEGFVKQYEAAQIGNRCQRRCRSAVLPDKERSPVPRQGESAPGCSARTRHQTGPGGAA